MSCNKPLLCVQQGYTNSGKPKYVPVCSFDRRKDYDKFLEYHPEAIKIPCGKCAGCRAQKTREWADRMILELDHSKKAIFLTLTYNDEHLPVKVNITTGQMEMTLQKRDLTLFFKRLRKRYGDREIRYYAVGEYGKNTNRPHYHIILYGLSMEDFKDITSMGNNELGQPYFKSDSLAKDIWKLGFCLVSSVSWNTCAYVARYVKKKDYGLVSDEFVDRSREPEYSVMSRNPGIGMYYPKEHEDFKEKSVYYFGDQNGLVSVHFPSAFLRYLENVDPDKYKELKDQRFKAADDTLMSKLMNTDLSSMELDEISENRISSTADVIEFYRAL